MKNVDKVKELYEQGLGVSEIGRELEMRVPNVCFYLNKAFGKDRVKGERYIYINRKYTLDDRYFEVINSEDKAYFLGLLYADGCMSNTSNAIQTALQEGDAYILETFKKFIKSDKPLGTIKSSKVKGFENMKRDYYRKPQKIFIINSQRIKKQLLDIGLTPNKSLTLTFPNLYDQTIIHHFIRGYFDGDGGIFSSPKNRWAISIAGTKSFLDELSKILKSTNIKNKVVKNNKQTCYYLTIHGRLNCIDFYNYVYYNSSIYLVRKLNKFKECINSTDMIRYGNTWKKKDRVNS